MSNFKIKRNTHVVDGCVDMTLYSQNYLWFSGLALGKIIKYSFFNFVKHFKFFILIINKIQLELEDLSELFLRPEHKFYILLLTNDIMDVDADIFHF